MPRQIVPTFVLLFGAFCAVSAGAQEPKGYIVGTVTFQNKDWVAEYRPKTAELLEKYGGRILVRDAPLETLEGSAPAGNAILVVEFPSVEQALAWHNDPEYAPLRELRQSGSTADWVLVKGLGE